MYSFCDGYIDYHHTTIHLNNVLKTMLTMPLGTFAYLQIILTFVSLVPHFNTTKLENIVIRNYYNYVYLSYYQNNFYLIYYFYNH